jgi:hypothetical protein
MLAQNCTFPQPLYHYANYPSTLYNMRSFTTAVKQNLAKFCDMERRSERKRSPGCHAWRQVEAVSSMDRTAVGFMASATLGI